MGSARSGNIQVDTVAGFGARVKVGLLASAFANLSAAVVQSVELRCELAASVSSW